MEGVRRVGALLARAAAIACVAAGVAGCGGSSALPPGNKIPGSELTVYVSVPLSGESAVQGEAVIRAASLALAHIHNRIGRYQIVLKALNDASPTSGEPAGPSGPQARWNPGQTTLDAHIAIANPTTIGYIGDFDSGASAVSIPLLNRLDIVQISPWSTAVGLTSDKLGSSPGEPEAYYPTSRRTFARVVPNDLVQAQAQVTLQKSLGCRADYVLYDGEYDGEETENAFVALAPQQGLPVIAEQSYVPSAGSFTSIGQTVAQSGANCVLIAAITDAAAAALTAQVAAQVPHDLLFGTAGLAESTFTDPAQGGIPLSLDHRILITAPAGDPAQPNARASAFYAQYERLYGAPEPAAIDGYEAMSLLLSAIGHATDHGQRRAERSAVVAAVFHTRDRHSVLGTYRIEADGDTSLNVYGVYRVVDGQLQFWRTVTG